MSPFTCIVIALEQTLLASKLSSLLLGSRRSHLLQVWPTQAAGPSLLYLGAQDAPCSEGEQDQHHHLCLA